jgi:hypothetical protein
MNVKQKIFELENLISELKKYDENLPIEMMVEVPHSCCSNSQFEDSRCYCSGENYIFETLRICREEEFSKKDNCMVPKKLWLKGYECTRTRRF